MTRFLHEFLLRRHSADRPASLITLAHLAWSLFEELLEFVRASARISSPCASKLLITDCRCSVLFKAELILSMVSFGVPAGASKPNHVSTSDPGKPCSTMVGTSGNQMRVASS